MSSKLSPEPSGISQPPASGADDAVTHNEGINSLDAMDGFSVNLSVWHKSPSFARCLTG
jgi:hypothetical protein